MTQPPIELSQETKERIKDDAFIVFPHIWDEEERAGYVAGAAAEALLYQQLHSYTEKLKEVLRFADCPELIIENPDFIKGKKPTDEDMEWARAKVKEYIAVEKSKDEQIAGLRKALQTLVDLKVCKDQYGKDDGYHERQPVAWHLAVEALKQY